MEKKEFAYASWLTALIAETMDKFLKDHGFETNKEVVGTFSLTMLMACSIMEQTPCPNRRKERAQAIYNAIITYPGFLENDDDEEPEEDKEKE